MFQKVFDFFITTVDDGGISYEPTTAGNIALFILILLLLIITLAVSGNSKKKLDARQLAFSAVAMTLAAVTSVYTVFEFPFGGSITLFRMLFICLVGYLYGPKVGIVTGVAYGFLDFMIKPYVISPIQMLMDYPLAFGCLGLAGVFSKSKYGLIKGYVLGVMGRYLCHVLTGVIFFSEYAGTQNPLIYSLGYNASYIMPEAAATLLLLFIPVVRNALSEVKRMATEN